MPERYTYLISRFKMAALLCLMHITGVAAAGNYDSLPAARQTNSNYDFIIPADSLSGTIPFSMAGNLIVIQATADSISGNFILDTGAPGLILNLAYFRDYPDERAANDGQNGITGEVGSGAGTVIPALSFGPFGYNRVYADRIYLGHLENSKGIKILGLLGIRLFCRFEMVIDYEHQLLHLHRIGRKAKRGIFHAMLQDTAKYAVVPLLVGGGKLFTQVQAGGNRLNFVVDTGAESNVIDSRLSSKVFDMITITRKVTLLGAGDGKKEAWYGELSQLNIGQVDHGSTEVLITNLGTMSAAYGKDIDGMLGYNFMMKQKIGFNFMMNKMFIWK